MFVHLPYTCYWIVSFTGGDLLLPVDNDFRSFRLDNNGFWYYKPGQSPATATDRRGNKICDPRKTVYEPHEFFRFMYAERWSTPSGKFFVSFASCWDVSIESYRALLSQTSKFNKKVFVNSSHSFHFAQWPFYIFEDVKWHFWQDPFIICSFSKVF